MWVVNGKEICMTEGDYGIRLPITINGITFSANDALRFTIKRGGHGQCCDAGISGIQTIVTKSFSNIQNNTLNFELTKEETDRLPHGAYIYSLDWYQQNQFMCNLVPSSSFKVVDKA